ncbi:hypothetical protein MKEN_00325000 [Mycena kentingensis (nom. inval.)]|nr:hypothetical protein MKEN_00325000 [Mycena kentingensis (nom. inval.)]
MDAGVALSPADIENAIRLIQSAYDPAASDPAAIQSLQNALMQMQKTRAAWGLIVPLLSHHDPNCQFFGAHTAHVKISRGELESLASEERDGLKDTLLALVGLPGRKSFVQKKLYAALTALALRLVPERSGRGWEGWIEATVRAMVEGGLGTTEILHFLAGAAEDFTSANLLPQPKIAVRESFRAATPMVLQSIAAVVTGSTHDLQVISAALACLLAWHIASLTSDEDLVPLIPPIIALLDIPDSPAVEAVSELLGRTPTSWGDSLLVEPVLMWAARTWGAWYQPADCTTAPWYPTVPVSPNFGLLRKHMKLVVALAEAAAEWVAKHLVDASACVPSGAASSSVAPSRASLAQLLVRLMLALTALDEGGAPLPEWRDPRVDDDDDDLPDSNTAGAPLDFWYMLQESLWDCTPSNAYLFSPSISASRASTPTQASYIQAMDEADAVRGMGGVGGTPFTPGINRVASYSFGAAASGAEDDIGDAAEDNPATQARKLHSQAAFGALAQILRQKVVYRRSWLTNEDVSEKEGKDREMRFKTYRREVGNTLINAFYILRNDMLEYYTSDAVGRLERREPWEQVEGTLLCLEAVNEAVDFDTLAREVDSGASNSGGAVAFARLFGGQLWQYLPTSATAPNGSADMPLNLRLQEKAAMNRLRKMALQTLDTYSTYFTHRPPEDLAGPLNYVLASLWDEDKLVAIEAAVCLRGLCDANRQALASQIDSFSAVHARLDGVPDQFKQKVLQGISSVIQALPPSEGIVPLETMVAPIVHKLKSALGAAGTHPEAALAVSIQYFDIIAAIAKGLTRLSDGLLGGDDTEGIAGNHAIYECIVQMAELWSTDAEACVMLSDLFKALTALPDDITLISLPAGPLLGVVCRAAERQISAVWLSLATILIAQLNPPPLLLTDKSGPTQEAEQCVQGALPSLVGTGLRLFTTAGGMAEPDVVQEFFVCMDRTAQDFTAAFGALPDGAFDALIQCAITALSLPERYSLVSAGTFLGTIIHRAAIFASISPEILKQLQAHMIRVHGRSIMRAVLAGLAGAAPRSSAANLLELLSALVTRWDEQAVGEAFGGEGQKIQGGARAWAAEILFADDFYPSRAGPEAKERLVKTLVGSRSVKKIKEAANQFMMIAWGLEGSAFGYSSVSV